MRALALIVILTLAACATPRQICERDALHDLNVLDALIVETRQTLERGYAVRRDPYTRPRLEMCYRAPFGDNRIGMTFCNSREIAYRDRPVAVDLAAERRKLTSLEDRRKITVRTAARQLALCRAGYPEG